MACKIVEDEIEDHHHLSKNRTTAKTIADISKLPPDRVSEEIKPGFFYRVQSKANR